MNALSSKLLRITGAFEGAGFVDVTGNLDGMGLSFGILQWNFGQRNLAPLLLKMHDRNPARFKAYFGAGADLLLQACRGTHETQMAFARSINNASNKIVEPWRGRFRKLGADPAFQDVQVQAAQYYIDKAKAMAREYSLRSERGLVLMFDIAVQNGSISPETRKIILEARQRKVLALEREVTEREFLDVIAYWRARAARPEFVDDVLARKRCIVHGSGIVHGRLFNLDKDFGLCDEPWEDRPAE